MGSIQEPEHYTQGSHHKLTPRDLVEGKCRRPAGFDDPFDLNNSRGNLCW